MKLDKIKTKTSKCEVIHLPPQRNCIFPLAPEARIWHNGCAESFSRADVVLRVPSGRAAWLADGAEEGFCNYLMFKGRE